MDRNAIAKELAELGKSDARLLRKLEQNRARRCEILSAVSQHKDAGLDADVVVASVQPKD